MKRWLALLLLCAALPVWAGLSAHIDRARVRAGESFQLLIEKSGQYDGEGPDLSPLDRDFDLLGNGRSSQISIVNGQMSSTTQWTITLAPKRSGTLTVPPIELDGDWTPSFPIRVGASTAPSNRGSNGKGAASGNDDLFLEVETSPESPYVQAQLTYRVRVLRTVDFSNASLSDPEVEGAVIERIGDDVSYDATRNGRRYQVIERRYAIFPEQAGPLKITGPVLNAEIPQRGGGGWRDPFQGLFTRTRPVQIKGKDRTVQVRPAAEKGDWLPAEALTLKEKWSPETPQWKVGEPVTRTLTLVATGLTGAHLPPIYRAPQGADVNGYPDQPTIGNAADGDRMIGTRTERIALVPSRPGPFTLPEIRIHWWDTAADRAREAVIPAHTIQVAAADGSGNSAPPPAQSTPSATPVAKPAESVSPLLAATPAVVTEWPLWRWLTLLFATLWVITGLLWWRHTRQSGRGRAAPEREREAAPAVGEGEARKRLRRACEAGDAAAARAALLAWGAARWPERPPFSLGALAERLEPGPAVDALRELDRLLYHPDEGAWSAKAWLERVSPALKGVKGTAAAESPIPGLYI
ncbi:BatD family protein [Endothiovibrio diazotrophicus]